MKALKRKRVLTPAGEDLLMDYWDYYGHKGGCYCHTMRMPPCSVCTHPGHPLSLEAQDEYWITQTEQEARAARVKRKIRLDD